LSAAAAPALRSVKVKEIFYDADGKIQTTTAD